MIRVRTKNNRPRFFRGGIEFGRGWLTLTEPGDPGDESIDLTAEQAAAIRAEKRFLDVEDIDAEKAARIVSPQPSSGSSVQGDDPAAQAAGESSGKNTPTTSGDDPASPAAAQGEPSETEAGPDEPAGDAAQPKAQGPALVNVNTASAAQIAKAALGIGPATARDLIKHRMANGAFERLDDLTRVGGIGKNTVERNRDRLTV